ncbi:MAG: phosphosulfolactate synthase [Pseudonocardia sp.]|nr:phosphosulfolactate synthase [Pseudonocardia sp.]
MPEPTFLDLPARSVAPRTTGLTHVIDNGIGVTATSDVLNGAGRYIDIWKVGWGVAYVDAALHAKIELVAGIGVDVCLGGTLLEIAWAQGRAAECLAWAKAAGFTRVEVSRGTVDMSLAEKHTLIARAARDFGVLAEVGSKVAGEVQQAQRWPVECRGDLDAGAMLVVTEGRQSGTVGTFDQHGRVRADVVEAVAGAVGVERVIFEAPQASQQAWFVRRFGAGVNLGNVAPADVLSAETLRLGLRADTARVPDAASDVASA